MSTSVEIFISGLAKLKVKWTEVNWNAVDYGLLSHQFTSCEMESPKFADIYSDMVTSLLILPYTSPRVSVINLLGGLGHPLVRENFRIYQKEYVSKDHKYLGVYLSHAFEFIKKELDLSIPENIVLGTE